MPHGQFKELVRLKPQGVGIEIDKNVIMFEAEKVIQDSRSKLDAYAGYYFSYYNSMSNPGKILKSLTKIYRTPFSMNIKTLEVIGEQNHDGFTCKYEGACFTLGDRLFITAMETLTRNEAIQIILYPSYTNRIRYLSGVMSGVAAHASRPPTATQIVLQFLGTNVDIRKSLGLCGLLLPGDDRIPADVQRMISGDLREGTHLLEAAPI
ncbi:hypothetical protein ROA7450_01523 [Roseovarius albus]|uniref:Uncharacterized protein n=2 Tax=Roseovarius albus TaxID=1247867 RepID=A0A1X6YXG3_9RHOB|nr:hypothetical protein ROA7450_01523 [Roseovarius albus]